ncbi:MAG: transporter substrate-binding protein [Thermomicrobiales bacterium]|jgi:ribose transport system substrate-binding protein|nr:transporter substrate-binding protein [Thermomicrobiales bacterium]MDF3040596.1 transporter substrate-binding protein [Thermomicrobiales bacterium]
MDRYLRNSVGRRSLIRGAAAGAGALGLGLSGAGRFGSLAWAQESTPAASGFDAEACYQPFAGAEPVQYEKLADPPYNIALSNSYIGNVWRTQMIKMAKAYAETPDIAPLISEFQVNTADRDDAAQIAAIENMISNGAQALVILAHTPTALVQTVQQARADGIVVVSFDTTVQADPPDPSLDLGVTVNEDQVEMGRRWAQWLVEQTGGEGKILMVNGVQGTGVDTERRQGAFEVWEENPGIEPIEVVGDWDPGKAQTVTATALAANPDFVGVWCQGGTDGVVRAFIDAGVPLVPVAGEAENGFRKQMLEMADQFQGYSIGQTPGLVCVSMRAALSLLMGEPVPRAVSVPLPEAKTEDLVPGVNVFPDAPDNFFTATSIPACGVNLSFEEVDAQEV